MDLKKEGDGGERAGEKKKMRGLLPLPGQLAQHKEKRKKKSRTTAVHESLNRISARLSAEEGLEKRTPSSTLSPAGTVTILLLLGGRGCAEERRGKARK